MPRLNAAKVNIEIVAGIVVLGAMIAFVVTAILPLARFGGEAVLQNIASPRISSILRFTLWQAFLSTLLSIVLAIPLASALARRRNFKGRVWLIRLMAAPMGLPALVGAFGLLAIWGRQGLINDISSVLGLGRPLNIYGLTGILIAHVFFNLPLAARLFWAGLERAPPHSWKLAASLGMESGAIFRKIEWPLIKKLIPGVAGLIFMLCATSFTLVLVLGGGPRATTLEVAIYQALKFDFDPPFAVSLVLMQVTVMAMILLGLALLPRAAEDKISLSLHIRRFDGQSKGMKALDIAVISCFALFCASPLIAIAIKGLSASFPHLLSDPLFWRALMTSLLIGSAASLLAVFIAYVFAQTRASLTEKEGRLRKSIAEGFHLGGSLSLVLPPIVLATGWFLWLRGASNWVPFALVITINALMALPFALRVLDPAIKTHRHRTSTLARSLGVGGVQRFALIDWPVLRKSCLTAFAFAFALSLGDLGAVALFGGNQLITLPWLLYAKLGSYRTTDAASLAFLLSLVCLTLAVLGTPKEQEAAEKGRAS